MYKIQIAIAAILGLVLGIFLPLWMVGTIFAVVTLGWLVFSISIQGPSALGMLIFLPYVVGIDVGLILGAVFFNPEFITLLRTLHQWLGIA